MAVGSPAIGSESDIGNKPCWNVDVTSPLLEHMSAFGKHTSTWKTCADSHHLQSIMLSLLLASYLFESLEWLPISI